MEHTVVNGSIHKACKQHQICLRILCEQGLSNRLKKKIVRCGSVTTVAGCMAGHVNLDDTVSLTDWRDPEGPGRVHHDSRVPGAVPRRQ